MSSGWLGTFFPGEALPLDEPRLTDFEALNPPLGRCPPPILRSVELSTPAARVSPAPSAWLPDENAAAGQAPAGSARSSPAKLFRWTNRA